MRKVSFPSSLKWSLPICLMLLIIVPTVALAHSNSSVAAATTYQATWASVGQHNPAPEWFKDAKFGIYFHWGVFSVPAFGSEWYPRNMYNRSGNSSEYQHHMQVFGDPFGNWPYANFINGANNKAGQWTQFAPKLVSAGGAFDPDAWAQLFADAGAKFAGQVAEHHDGFSMWDSSVNEWNSVDKGPRLDLARLFATSIRAKGMKFFMSNHNAYNFTGYYQWVPAQSDPSLKKLYGQLSSTEEYQLWVNKLKEMIDGYQPDIIYHDFNVNLIPESYRLQFLAYYYNAAIDWNKEVINVYKDGSFRSGELQDYERGGPADITSYYWLTDDSVSWTTWGYTQGMGYYSTAALLHAMIDRVSKNGNMILSIAPMADGTIPSQQQTILRGMGDWLKKYGEAIYSTRAWTTYGEGPTKMGGGGMTQPTQGTAQDFRYTRSKDNSIIYAIELGWPGNGATVTMTSLASGKISNPTAVQLITGPGTYTNLSYQQTSTGLRVTMPSSQPFSAPAYAIKVTLSGPMPERATFYQDVNYGGSAVSLSPGTYTTAQLSAAGIPDNWASSVRVPAGFTVEIYDLDNLGGTRWAFTADNADFIAAGLNDKMSSVRITGTNPTTVPPTTVPPTSVPNGTVSINAGGAATGSFVADQYFSGGSTYTNTATIDMSQIPTNAPPAAVFNTERYGAMTYTIPNRSGAQTVTLYFAETYLTAAGQRSFNVSINGAAALSNFDIYASAGGANRAIFRTFNTTANSSGQVVIQFTAVTENPKINGIMVAAGTNPTQVPPTSVPPTGVPPTSVPPTGMPPASISINAGGAATGSFTADQYFSGGSTYTNTRTIDMSQIPANTAPAAVFSTERYGAMTYTIPNLTAGRTYTVTLYFAETYVTAAGQRLFNVSINGSTVLSNFDIYASAGGVDRAIARSFTTTANSSGQVVIQFISGTQNPKINAITVSG